MHALENEIELFRKHLVDLAEKKNFNFQDAEVQALSCKLDRLIVEYQSLTKPYKTAQNVEDF